MSAPVSRFTHRLKQQLQAALSFPSIRDGIARQQPDRPRSEQGVTLIECLVAISIIAITGALITPPLFVAAATRIQNRRAEQALQLAQGEVDRIRILVARGMHTPAALPNTVATFNNTVPAPAGRIAQVRTVNTGACPAGTNITRYDGTPLPVNSALGIDVDGDCRIDFLMQVFRSQGAVAVGERAQNGGQNRPTEFQLGVRVYSASADGNWANLRTQQASLRFTTGQGNQRERPLAVLLSPINWSDTNFALCQYHQSANRNCN